MATFSLHGFSFFRHSRRTAMLVYCSVLAAIYLDSVNCAVLASNSTEQASALKLENSRQNQTTLSRRQLLPVDHILANSPYLQVPAVFGLPPIYQNVQQIPAVVPHYPTIPAVSKDGATDVRVPQAQKKRQKVKVNELKTEVDKEPNDDDQDQEVTEDLSSKRKNKKGNAKKEKLKKEKLQKEANELEKVESKAAEDEGTERGCPACVGGPCDPFLDTSVNISGIPIIQIIIALAVGAFWAAIFAFILHNFIEYQKEGEGGYGYSPAPAPEYGAPHSEYGAPQSEYGAPQSEYGAPSSHNRVSYGYGRSSQGVSFNNLSNWVWEAIDKYVSKYDD